LVGSTYLDAEAALEEQWAEVTPSRRKTVRRLVQRLITEAGSLAAAGDHLVPVSFQQGSLGNKPSDMPRCTVCRSRGKQKCCFPSEAAAQRFCDDQRDSGLVVYACAAGRGWHLGHPATATQRRESNRNHEHEAQTQTTSQQK